MKEETNQNSEEPEKEGKGIPLRWILYVILGYALFQTFYFWWSVRGE